MSDFILPHAMPHALDGRDDITLLSLDCFDTLLWRDCHAPTDLFETFTETSKLQRCWAEHRARDASKIRRGRKEVAIEEIYGELLPNARKRERAQAVQVELDSEAAHCFAFQPTVRLMQEAKRRGIKTIIVSDTYLNAGQLRGLIAAAAGKDVADLIDQVFCSSVLGLSKSEGLFGEVLKRVDAKPAQILHIGDNPRADVEGVKPFGIQTLHLRQFGDATAQRLRLEAAAGSVIHPEVAGTIGTPQPHRATLAAVEPGLNDPAEAFGFAALGPVFTGFSRWLAAESAAIEAERGGRVHYLFMMRDGHLPMRLHEAIGNPAPAHAIEISRYTATAANLRTPEAVERFLQSEGSSDMPTISKQLLLSSTEIATLARETSGMTSGTAFLKAVRSPRWMKLINRKSRAFAQRLVEHVRAAVQPERGDTLMLVDLGYNGSAQNEVDTLLRDSLGVHVAGRYLLLREQNRTGLDKRGFIDACDYDGNALDAMCSNVAVVEQLATAAQGSVVDYAEDGTPIRRDSSIKARQSEVRERVQAGCLRFAAVEGAEILRADNGVTSEMWRRASTAALMRLMFLPIASELEVLGAFEHDVNLGTDQTVSLFDRDIAVRGLRQRGLFYMKGASRMYLPAELQGEGLSMKLALMTHRRFGLPLKNADFIDRSIALPVIVSDGQQATTGKVTATATHDGYFVAPIPVGDSRYTIGIQFGQLFEYVQLDSAVFLPVDRFMSDKQRPGLDEIEAFPALHGMEQVAPHLFRCDDGFSFMTVPPPELRDGRAMMLAVVFRPIAERQGAAASAPQPGSDAKPQSTLTGVAA
ncbi:HAD family hydrolase [Stakelama tenebrarum]|uniref:HAD family hydrolase n=1 Tax=Stakelama tenebrarum TaxID=2711215 RepID=A0A6G6Y574_9SPHN|nr:HAD family hydrolase [Sphingosinithalassobacter tenebrarum]QIG79726.1 HAD family hydrolase [Sphingosinithalassobacter tenebrarum]